MSTPNPQRGPMTLVCAFPSKFDMVTELTWLLKKPIRRKSGLELSKSRLPSKFLPAGERCSNIRRRNQQVRMWTLSTALPTVIGTAFLRSSCLWSSTSNGFDVAVDPVRPSQAMTWFTHACLQYLVVAQSRSRRTSFRTLGYIAVAPITRLDKLFQINRLFPSTSTSFLRSPRVLVKLLGAHVR